MKTALRFYPGGRVKAIHDDGFPFEDAFGPDFAKARRRASVINTVESGPYAGYFYADMGHLAALHDDPTLDVCLWPPQKTEAACKAQEVAFIGAEYIHRPLTADLKTSFKEGRRCPDANS